MAAREWLYIFAYDVRKDYDRTRLAKLLDEDLVRVQLSVFEGFLTPGEAQRLADRADGYLGPDDSLRVYAISAAGHARSFVRGAGTLPEREGYYLL